MSDDLVSAYSQSGDAWRRGPTRVYDPLAEVVADSCPVGLVDALVLDLGAGTGAATRAAERRGAHVIAVDAATGMLAADASNRPSAAAGDARALPFKAASFDAVLAAFSLNHLTAPVTGLREAVRVLREGGGLVVAAYAADDGHPARAATESAAEALGWRPPAWTRALREEATVQLSTVERAKEVAAAAGLVGAVVTNEHVPFPALGSADLVAWRLGMAQLAPFVATLSQAQRDTLVRDAMGRLADAPMLVRSVILVSYRATR